MGLKKRPDFKRIEKKVIGERSSKLVLLSNEIIVGIINRTQKGKDITLHAFKKYTKEYKKSKSKTHGSSKVNLTRESSMLNAITFVRIKNGIRIKFNSTNEAKKAKSNMRKRKFFGLDKKQRAWIKEKLSIL